MSTTLEIKEKPPERYEAEPVPPLKDGDQLSRAEFERRYQAMPALKKAELIDGVVYVPSPVQIDTHSEPHFDLIIFLGVYKLHTPGVAGGDNGTLDLTVKSMPQPDIFLRIRPECGGQARIGANRYLEGAPELVAEVSSTSAAYDLGEKLRMYERAGVKEYLVWRPEGRIFDWFERQAEKLVRIEPVDGVHRSKAFPGLWLDVDALVRGKEQKAYRTLRQGLDSEEHAAFVRQLGFSHDDDD